MKKAFLLLLTSIVINSMYAVDNDLILQEKFPKKLSEFLFFQDPSAQIPSEGVIPYELISSLFSDYSYKQRWVYVPMGKKANFVKDEVFDFPIGSALIKTFYYPVDERDATLGKRLMETRLLLRKSDGWDAVSYAWNETQDEAFIKKAGKTILNDWIDFNGKNRSVRYRVPNKNQCKECHAKNDLITPIGPKARNLDKVFDYPNESINQLTKWMKVEYIDKIDVELNVPVNWEDEHLSLDARVKSYLDINCGHCHSSTGNANSTGLYLDLTENRPVHRGIFKKPVATGRGSGGHQYSISPGNSEESIMLYRMISIDPGVMMPESGRSLSHNEAIDMIREWIDKMEI
tara:strand:+ start:4691 stop:5728 length:1038 start_codon:yes stop_codon:yes gene_type:complete